MARPRMNRALLTDLSHEAQRLAEQRGHRLSPFSNARHDQLRYVSFCTACGGLVIVDVDPDDCIAIRRIYGYALEANCTCGRKAPAAPAA
jgi:hypothetical protein